MIDKGDSRRAQSDVIGAILLVVITIALASLVAVYVFEVGGGQLGERPPQASFTFQNDAGTVSANHAGGVRLDGNNVFIVVNDDGTTPTAVATGETGSSGGTTRVAASDTDAFGSTTIQVGDQAVVATNVGENDIVRIVYVDPTSNQGTALGRFEG